MCIHSHKCDVWIQINVRWELEIKIMTILKVDFHSNLTYILHLCPHPRCFYTLWSSTTSNITSFSDALLSLSSIPSEIGTALYRRLPKNMQTSTKNMHKGYYTACKCWTIVPAIQKYVFHKITLSFTHDAITKNCTAQHFIIVICDIKDSNQSVCYFYCCFVLCRSVTWLKHSCFFSFTDCW